MSPKEVMKKGKEPEGGKNATRRCPRGRKYRYQTKCLAECPGRIFHMYQGQASQVFLKTNPVYETRYLNKQQKMLPLPFLWLLWLLIWASGQRLRKCVPVRKFQSNTGIGRGGMSKGGISQSELQAAAEGALANHDKEKAPWDRKTLQCHVGGSWERTQMRVIQNFHRAGTSAQLSYSP